ncbi:endonuclease III [Orientia chuto str. Dubai]|uniref:Endonuclease III n=1 Tax=Orientia chuto str. Dubai TaxID=1359168 RepID=A0A0F3ML30_9RICK|nr:endonuclease III [Candidatus Orientia mediorientalis]KJV56356.1 endonuclease III [Orientia chuto str. Dubai]
MNDKIESIFIKFSERCSNPKTELEYDNHFTLLVAVILSAQSTDNAVNRATRDLFKSYNTPEQFLQLGEENLKKYIKSIGLYNNKAKNIIKLSEILVKEYDGKVPDAMEKLVALPGVGRKSANVVLSCAFGVATMPVDTHVFRVAKRLGLAKGTTPLKVEHELLSVISAKWLLLAHHWLVLHGRYICKAQSPKCSDCFLNDDCQYFLSEQNKCIS